MKLLLLTALCAFASAQALTTTTTVFCTPNKCGPRGVCVENMNLCLCPADLGGAYCQVNVCVNQEGQCVDIQTPTVIAPADTEISCAATDIRPSALGNAFFADNCGTSSSNLKTNSSDKVLRRSSRNSCPNAFIIERTFQATDRCYNTARDSQRIFVDDTQAPTIRARFIPLPAMTKSMNGVGFGKVLSSLDGPAVAGLGVSLGVLLNAARQSGIDPAVLLSALSSSGGKGTSNSDLSSILAALGGSSGSSNVMDMIRPKSSDSSSSMSSMSSMFSTLPTLSSNGGATTTSNGQTQVSGVTTCNPPELRGFVLQCNITDDCSSKNSIQFGARLRVTHITNRNAFFVASTMKEMPMPSMPMKPMAVESDGWVVSKTGVQNMMGNMNMEMGNMNHNMNDMNMNMNMPGMDMSKMDMSNVMDKLQSMGPGIFKNGDKVVTVVGDRWKDMGMSGVGTTMTGDSWSNMNMGNMGHNMNMGNMGNMHMGNMGNMNMGNMGNMNMGNMGNMNMGHNMNMGNMGNMNMGHTRSDWSDSLFPEGPATTRPTTGSATGTECLTATDFVDIRCGDTVLIQLDREDSCLANDFVAGSPFSEGRSLSSDDFGGPDVLKMFMAKFGLSGLSSSMSSSSASTPLFDNNGFQTQAGGKILAVRGTSVQAQVRAVDECDNVETVWLDVSDLPCDSFVAGRCCPPITAGARLVNAASNNNNNNNHMMSSPLDFLRNKPM